MTRINNVLVSTEEPQMKLCRHSDGRNYSLKRFVKCLKISFQYLSR